ncbi:hypothetical protein RF11_08323 [Thelohanellus kitauei]|uniref:Uncharacterized protein n=1 Tax=Thelohanellus kitauei TaxID=669202 RepID=A0A0C2N972_THEKT|nr:hypothetical protein RF11_08323 [Thelohanellus kitauei]
MNAAEVINIKNVSLILGNDKATKDHRSSTKIIYDHLKNSETVFASSLSVFKEPNDEIMRFLSLLLMSYSIEHKWDKISAEYDLGLLMDQLINDVYVFGH